MTGDNSLKRRPPFLALPSRIRRADRAGHDGPRRHSLQRLKSAGVDAVVRRQGVEHERVAPDSIARRRTEQTIRQWARHLCVCFGSNRRLECCVCVGVGLALRGAVCAQHKCCVHMQLALQDAAAVTEWLVFVLMTMRA